MEPYFIKSKRGRNVLVYGGYIYHKHSESKEKSYWVCVKKPECNGSAVTRAHTLEVLSTKDHTHAPNKEKIKAIEFVNNVKKESEEHPELLPSQLVGQALNSAPSDVLPHLPQISSMKRTLSRWKHSQLLGLQEILHDFQVASSEETTANYSKLENPGDSFGASRTSDIEDTLQVVLVEGETKSESDLYCKDRSQSSFSNSTAFQAEEQQDGDQNNIAANQKTTCEASGMSHLSYSNPTKEVNEDVAPKRTRKDRDSVDNQRIPTNHPSTYNESEDVTENQHDKTNKKWKSTIKAAFDRVGSAQEASSKGISRIAAALEERNSIEKERNVMLRELLNFFMAKSDL